MNKCQNDKNDNNNINTVYELKDENGSMVAEIFYDYNTDRLYFRGRSGKLVDIGHSGRSFKVSTAEPEVKMNYVGGWIERTYRPGDILVLQDGIYLCQEETSYPPDSKEWSTMIKLSNFSFLGEWEPKEYAHNTCIIDPNDRGYYISNKDTVSINPPSTDKNDWTLFMLPPEHKVSIPLIFAFFTNGSCCYRYDHTVNRSIFDPETCPYNHKTPDDADLYLPQEIAVKDDTNIIIPLGFISRCDTANFYPSQEPKSLQIINQGIYRCSYTIAYHGQVNDITAKVATVDQIDEDLVGFEDILFSINSQSNFFQDKQDFQKIRFINHTFILPVNETNLKVVLSCDVSVAGTNKIYIHPVQTWLSIEKLS